jgi:Uma2 family endonuclease
MSMQTPPRRWSYAEFARLPQDGNRYEVIAGELYMTPAPRTLHQKVVTRLTVLLANFVQQHDLGEVLVGPVDVLLAECDYLEPDLVFVRRGRSDIISHRGIEGAPDLVIEVTSPATAERDRGIKRQCYARFGVPEYWIVDPERGQVEVYRTLQGSNQPEVVRETLRWRLAPGAPILEVSLKDVFEMVDA